MTYLHSRAYNPIKYYQYIWKVLGLQRPQGFCYEMLSGEITKNRGTQVGGPCTRFLYAKHLLRIMYNPKKYHTRVVIVRNMPSQPCIQFYQVSIYLKWVLEIRRSQSFYYLVLSGEVTKKHSTESCGYHTCHAFSTSCSLLRSSINISVRVMELKQSQGF